MSFILSIIKAVANIFGFLRGRQSRRERQELRDAGADRASVESSKKLDKVTLDAAKARDSVSAEEQDILNDPNRRKP